MYNQRITKAISLLRGRAYLITDTVDTGYLTGVNLEGYWLLLAKNRAVIFASELLAGHLKELIPECNVVSGEDGIIALLASYCSKQGIKQVYADSDRINHALWQKLNSALKLQEKSGFVPSLRLIKERAEIELIKESCNITVSAMEYCKKLIKPGASENKIRFKIEEFFAKNHAITAFTPIVACGPNSARPHHIPGNRKIAKNDVILIDIGCVYKGYCSDLTRTFFLGKMNNFHKQIYNLVDSANKRAIKKARPGVKANSLDSVARSMISAKGYGREFIHSTGHGVGIEIHESPRLSKTDKTTLKPGMVITVEPGIYLPDKFGVRIEDTILITEKGNKVLTK